MKRFVCNVLLLITFGSADAGVSADKALRLKNELTPMGAERTGNEDGTIPAWTGGQTSAPPCYIKGKRYCDPFAADKPLFVINATNLDQYREKISAGQIDLIKRYPETYLIKVYPSRRSFANPPEVYQAAFKNATEAVLMPSGREIQNAKVAIPFPIAENGLQMIWNHRLRYRGPGFRRWFGQASVTTSGEATIVKMREDARFPYVLDDVGKRGVAQQWLQVVFAPENLRGYITLIQDTLDDEDHPPKSYQQVAGASRILRERSYGYDHAAMLSDGLRMDDQLDTYFGSPERYTWSLLAKRDFVVPYNSYALHSEREGLRDIIKLAHIDNSLARYEMHRVWIVEANTKPSSVHRIKRRRFYIDEDSWQILMVDLYDHDGRLAYWQETHTLQAYDSASLIPVLETIHDLDSGRYLVQGIDEDQEERVLMAMDEDLFTSSGARGQTPR